MIASLLLLAQLTVGASSQTIDGFGTAHWRGDNGTFWGGNWSDSQVETLFGCGANAAGPEICLNILRIGIANSDSPGEVDGTAMGVPFMDFDRDFSDSISLARRAAKYQPSLKVFAEPWSANAACKSGGSINGGSFLTACNTSWSTWIGNAVDFFNRAMADKGISLYAVGSQNEPDFNASYQSCTFTAAAHTAWLKVLCPVLAVKSPAPLCMGPGNSQWSAADTYIADCTADPTCLSGVGLWSTHQYPAAVAAAPGTLSGRHKWMTEMSFPNTGVNDGMTGSDGGLAWAQLINDALVTGQVNAWIAWRGVSEGGQDDGLIDQETTSGHGDHVISKRLWTLGNYSKFVRPGMVRFALTGTPPTNVSASFFKDPTTNNIAIVAINTNATTTSITVTLDPTTKCRVMVPSVTDPSNNLAVQSPVILSGISFTYPLSGSSVTSFTCNGSL